MRKFIKNVEGYVSYCSQNFIVLNSVITHTCALLKSFAEKDMMHEGIVYWVGYETANLKVVTTCITPNAITTVGSFDTDEVANADVIRELSQWKSVLLAQVHSHPGRIVDHSDGDNERAFMPFNGFLSVVVPNYAARGMLPLTVNGFHLYHGGHFFRLSDRVVSKVISIVPNFVDMRSRR